MKINKYAIYSTIPIMIISLSDSILLNYYHYDFYANALMFKDKRAFVESEFLRQNSTAFGYERFEYLYFGGYHAGQ